MEWILAKTVILNNISFLIPESGDQNYAEELTDYLVELSTVLGTLQGPLDIINTTFNFANNQVAPANIIGFIFPTASVTRFEAEYVITRSTALLTSNESGILIGTQGDSGWSLSRKDVHAQNGQFDSVVGVTFDITSGGQITYTSEDLTGQTLGTITFNATTVEQ